jgi:hypothetical protein
MTGVAVIVPTMSWSPLLVATKDGTVPAPDAPRPIDGLEFVQLVTAPELVMKLYDGINVPSYTAVSSLIVVVGTEFTSRVNEVVSVHCPGSGVKTYVAFTALLTTAGLHVPVIPLAEVVIKAGTDVPVQIDWKVPKLNVGFTIGFTVTVYMNGVTHCPGTVKVYIPLTWLLTTDGFHVPVKLLSDVDGRFGTVPPAHIVKLLPKLNTGSKFGVTVTVNVTGPVTHCPAPGVKI